MDIRELKQLLKNSVSLLILENGEPAFVVVDYKVYRDLMARDQEAAAVQGASQLVTGQPATGMASGEQAGDPKEVEVLERLNKEILALKSQIELEEKNLTQEQDEQE